MVDGLCVSCQHAGALLLAISSERLHMNTGSFKLLAGALALSSAVAGATFQLTRLATDSQVAALQLRVATLDGRIRELQAALGQRPAMEADRARQLVINSASPEPVSATFLHPSDGATVPMFVDVAFSLSGQLPPGHSVYLFVRDPIGQYWSWGSVLSGRYPRVQLGVSSDSGQHFMIGVLVTDKSFPIGSPTHQLPAGITPASITVTRD